MRKYKSASRGLRFPVMVETLTPGLLEPGEAETFFGGRCQTHLKLL